LLEVFYEENLFINCWFTLRKSYLSTIYKNFVNL